MSEDLGGNNLGKYELLERVGRGGMAEVYKALHTSLGRFVALKILHPFLGEDPQFKERFEQEARNVAQLRHTNIVQVYDFDFDPQRELYYMVMEYIDGPTLRARLMQLNFQAEHFSIPEAISITRDLASALGYAHSRGMIHRDLKPGNIMFDSDGRVVLTDFGIARIISGPNVTASGSMIGTPAYMSPEQGLGQSGDHRSDIYSLGIVLYQLLTGTTPYNADTPIAIVLKHVNDPLPPPTSVNPEIPEGLERIIYKALAKAPEERYQNVEEMAAHLMDLEAAASLRVPASAISGSYGVGLPELDEGAEVDDVRSGSRGCWGWVLLGVALLALVGGMFISYSGLVSRYLPFASDIGTTPTPTPTTSLPSITPTVTATEIVSTATLETSETVERATATVDDIAVPSIGATGTPDLTATVLACDYDYEVIEQTPESGQPYPELTSLTKRITIVNDSLCLLDDDTRLVFIEGSQLDGPDFVEFNQTLQPGDTFQIVLNLRTPRYDQSRPVLISTWAVVLPDGTRVGPLLTFEVRLFPSGG